MKKYLFYKSKYGEVYMVIPRRRQPYFLIYTRNGEKLSLSIEDYCEMFGMGVSESDD